MAWSGQSWAKRHRAAGLTVPQSGRYGNTAFSHWKGHVKSSGEPQKRAQGPTRQREAVVVWPLVGVRSGRKTDLDAALASLEMPPATTGKGQLTVLSYELPWNSDTRNRYPCERYAAPALGEDAQDAR